MYRCPCCWLALSASCYSCRTCWRSTAFSYLCYCLFYSSSCSIYNSFSLRLVFSLCMEEHSLSYASWGSFLCCSGCFTCWTAFSLHGNGLGCSDISFDAGSFWLHRYDSVIKGSVSNGLCYVAILTPLAGWLSLMQMSKCHLWVHGDIFPA